LTKVAPKGRYVSGKGVSGAGLTAAVVKDEFLGGWSLEAGALVLANKGFVMIDELDKMTKEDRSAMHEALEGQTVSISKANIQATLRAETTVLAAANPKFGRFDPYGLIMDQIDLPPTLINRFDLIFPIKDLPNQEKDERMADHILILHQKPDEIKTEIETDLLRKYIAYARQRIRPAITESALREIKNYYIKMRSSGQAEEGGVKSIPITARQLEALIRLAEASAKLRLSNKMMKKDAQRAIELINYCLSQVAKDLETGIIDIDRISSGIPAKERSKISIVREIIDVLEGEFGKVIPMENVVERAEEKGLKIEDVEEIIEKLRRSGDLYEPRKGFVSRI
jgi:replicative DNA helicase Mcm